MSHAAVLRPRTLMWLPALLLIAVALLAASGFRLVGPSYAASTGSAVVSATVTPELHIGGTCPGANLVGPSLASADPTTVLGSCTLTFGTNNNNPGGSLIRGTNGFTGEIGHMVVERNGLACSCGLRGCWETRASGNALGALGRQRAASQRAPGIVALAGGEVAAVRGEHVAAAARAGDPDALMLLAEWADSVAVGLANLTNIIDPDCFVLGGGLADIADLWLEGVRRRYRAHLDGADFRPRVEIRLAQLGSQAGAKGAALAARGASRA